MAKDGELQTTHAAEKLEKSLKESPEARSCGNCIKNDTCVAFLDFVQFTEMHKKTHADEDFIKLDPRVLAMSCSKFIPVLIRPNIEGT